MNKAMSKHLKLIIQIPCLNEEATLGETVEDIKAEIPRLQELVDEVELLIIDDGSTDRTIEVAREHGVHHVVKLPENKGLATAFQAGMDACLKLGADVILNTDADNQYAASSIYGVIQGIAEGTADMVIGARDIIGHEEFSPIKKKLQHLGSRAVSKAAKLDIEDTTSGFRAYNRRAAIELIIHNRYTYTLEGLISAGASTLAVKTVPIDVNPKTRDSRLFKSISSYVRRSASVIVKSAITYSPMRFFGSFALILLMLSVAAFAPFLKSWILDGDTGGHLQSIVVGVMFFVTGVQFLGMAVVASLIKVNRQLAHKNLEAARRIEISTGVPPEYLL